MTTIDEELKSLGIKRKLRAKRIILGAKALLKLKDQGMVNDWISLKTLASSSSNWLEILSLVDLVWRYHNQREKLGEDLRRIYNYIRYKFGDIHVKIKDPSEPREAVVAHKIWLLYTTKDKKLRAKRKKKLENVKFRFEFGMFE